MTTRILTLLAIMAAAPIVAAGAICIGGVLALQLAVPAAFWFIATPVMAGRAALARLRG